MPVRPHRNSLKLSDWAPERVSGVERNNRSARPRYPYIEIAGQSEPRSALRGTATFLIVCRAGLCVLVGLVKSV